MHLKENNNIGFINLVVVVVVVVLEERERAETHTHTKRWEIYFSYDTFTCSMVFLIIIVTLLLVNLLVSLSVNESRSNVIEKQQNQSH